MELSVLDSSGSAVGTMALPALFESRVNDGLLFEQVLAQRAAQRSGTASTKTRGKVRGGGAKPWRQKGSGRARAGSSRSPIWRGGGTTFGPLPRSYEYRLPRKARKAALTSALAQKARDGQIKIVDSLVFEEPKTKLVKGLLAGLGIEGSVMIVTPESDNNLWLGSRNLHRVLATTVAGLNVYDLLAHKTLLLARDAVAAIEEKLS